ncbi:glycoside hydrolase family 28 protein [Oleiharenicola lentus]|uniref:Glycoside hydrolase family 28 protein n=1 Tax=Oleiharenicola lentus TaxID=2508720 RepID=A0A4Q1CB91_9BACT|nr:glycoside hydrolase family 28 protein [Oleiharenicola lentus]RXK56172.1 glycoside hydrolase family 28 protein [Oleiharenicola lentus]
MSPTRHPGLFALLMGCALLLAFVSRSEAALTQPVVPTPPARPVIPATKVSLADFSAVADGETLNTAAFERALAALAERGGGTLVVPSGVWHTGPIRLRSRVNLHLEAGAIIQFSRDHGLYPMRVFDPRGEKQVDTTSPLSGDQLEDIAITGAGVIDGGGDAWRLVKRAKTTEPFWKALVASGGVLNARGDEWWPNRAALDGAAAVQKLEAVGSLNPADYEPYRVFLRPRLLRLLECRRVLIEGVTFRNAPNWTLHPWLCEDVTLRDVKIFNDRWAQNSDALDLESCRRVHVTGCIVDTGDDGLCLKSGKDGVGRRIGVPTEDVLIEDCTVYEGHGGFTIGSEMSGGVRNVLVRNCTFIGTALGLRFKTARGRGGVVENIHVQGIRMTGIEGSAIDFNFFYFSEGQAGAPVPPVTEETPVFRNILFEDIVSRGSKAAFTLRGLPEMPLRDITFRDVALSATTGADLGYGEHIVFERVSIRPQQGPPVRATAMTGSRLDLVP